MPQFKAGQHGQKTGHVCLIHYICTPRMLCFFAFFVYLSAGYLKKLTKFDDV